MYINYLSKSTRVTLLFARPLLVLPLVPPSFFLSFLIAPFGLGRPGSSSTSAESGVGVLNESNALT